jgi:hypothetical protein
MVISLIAACISLFVAIYYDSFKALNFSLALLNFGLFIRGLFGEYHGN